MSNVISPKVCNECKKYPLTELHKYIPDYINMICDHEDKLNVLIGSQKIIPVKAIMDGSIISHLLDGEILLQYVNNGQIQGGFYGEFIDNKSVYFRTPSLEGQIFQTGYLICTKLS